MYLGVGFFDEKLLNNVGKYDMNIVIFTEMSGVEKARNLKNMVESGGDKFMEISINDENDFDFVIQSGMEKPKKKHEDRNAILQKIKSMGKSILVLDGPAIRLISDGWDYKNIEGQWVKMAWHSFFADEAVFPYDPSYNRWKELQKEHDINVNEWKHRGDHILVCLQKRYDAAVKRIYDNGDTYIGYISDVVEQLKKKTDRPILIRSHPTDKSVGDLLRQKLPYVKISTNDNLYDDFNMTHTMVTYNSHSAVEAVLYGLPTVTLDSSAIAWDVSGKKVTDICNAPQPDRTEWLKRLAFMQWSVKELNDGYVWNLLKKCLTEHSGK